MDRIRATVRHGAPISATFADSDGWTVTLSYQGRTMRVPFYMGRGLGGKPPTGRRGSGLPSV